MPTDFGKVYLVGAGPGDPGLLTLRGAECLRAADVVLYDYLAGPELLHRTRPDAELVCLGRHGHGRLMSQTEINERHDPRRPRRPDRRATQRGRPGDLRPARPRSSPRSKRPACRTKSSPASPPPRPPAATPASRSPTATTPRASHSSPARSAATNRPTNRSTTRRSPNSPARSCSTWASPPRPQWSRALIAHGKSAGHAGGHRPPLHVRRSADDLHDARRRRRTLGPRQAAAAGGGDRRRGGPRARRSKTGSPSRPLFGQTVLVTRPAHQADAMVAQLRALGRRRALPAGDRDLAARAIGRPSTPPSAGSPTSIGSSSRAATASTTFSAGCSHSATTCARLAAAKLAAIGPATVDALAEYHLKADVCPDAYRAEALAEALAPHARGKAILPGPRQPRPRSARRNAHRRRRPRHASRRLRKPRRRRSRIPKCSKPSPPAASIGPPSPAPPSPARWSAMFGDALRHTKLVAISPLTAEVLAELGHPAGRRRGKLYR